MTTLKQLRKRRDNFIAVLDATEPGWKDLIDKNRLDMSYCEDCILGQLHGRYTYGMHKRGYNNEQAVEYALQAEKGLMHDLTYNEQEQLEEDYAKLTRVWKEVL